MVDQMSFLPPEPALNQQLEWDSSQRIWQLDGNAYLIVCTVQTNQNGL